MYTGEVQGADVVMFGPAALDTTHHTTPHHTTQQYRATMQGRVLGAGCRCGHPLQECIVMLSSDLQLFNEFLPRRAFA